MTGPRTVAVVYREAEIDRAGRAYDEDRDSYDEAYCRVSTREASEKLLQRLEHYHQEHDCPGMDDVKIKAKEKKHAGRPAHRNALAGAD